MPVHVLNWIGFLLYALVVVVVGIRSFRRAAATGKSDSPQEFWTAGQRLSGWASGLSISASMMSISWSCVYGVQLFYWYGLGALWLLAIPWLLAMLGFFLLAPRLRRLQAFSQPEMVGRRFGTRSRQLLAVPLAFVYLIWCGAEIHAAAHITAPLLQASPQLMMLLIALVVATYSALGGFEADVITDQIQFALVAFFIAMIAALGGHAVLQQSTLPDFFARLATPPKTGAPAVSLWSAGPALIIMTFIAYLPGWLVTTDVWIRLQAAHSVAEARRGVALAALNSFVFVTLGPLLIGLSALYLYPPQGDTIPARLAGGAAIFAVMMQDFAPPVLSVVLVVGLAAAAMSTIDTTGNVMALSLSYDIFEPALQSRWPPARWHKLPRFISVFAIAAAFVYALFIESLWDIFYLSSGVLTTTIFPPMAALFLSNIQPRQVHAAIAAGFVGTLLFYFLEAHGPLRRWEPAWLAHTELGYILWGLLAALLAFGLARCLPARTTARGMVPPV
ncbi:MAG: hypothetical protein ONB48_03235 [candidate division KSB1 bacterium]|nr:hypothetical protein [candidate division KSB1 bacterium]MDZ7275648.1 hypothetical protein [candidate division KSB1 bacterium]MDZ7284661.1 hypothetical protein [candidate division KSB1 bacterium]MDZ7297920.1 hypothetical protein [candidate division KSB1 bacterium]MDZ7307115.1 hypothetical protein [candidate division KSB1 bacterium]